MRYLHGFTLAISLLANAFSPAAQAQDEAPRLALIVANSNYSDKQEWDSPLNSGNDGVIAKAALEHVGFDVRFVQNLAKDKFLEEVEAFAGKVRAAPGATVVIYYAGHGLSFEAENYLIPVDGVSGSLELLQQRNVKLSDITTMIEAAGAKRAFLFVDACRTSQTYRGNFRRITPMSSQAPRKNLRILFSTAPGQLASNGPPGRYSPFAEAFADEIVKPARDIDFFRSVTDRVFAATQSAQLPWINAPSTSSDPFCFAGCGTQAPGVPATAPSLEAIARLNSTMRIWAVTASFDAEMPPLIEAQRAYTACSPTGDPEIIPNSMRAYCEFTSLPMEFDSSGELAGKYVPIRVDRPGGYIPADFVFLFRTGMPEGAQIWPSDPNPEKMLSDCRAANPLSTARQCRDWLRVRFAREQESNASFPRQRLEPARQKPLSFPRLAGPDGRRFPEVIWTGPVDLGKRDGCGIELMTDGRIIMGCFTADMLEGVVRVIDPKSGWWIARYTQGVRAKEAVDAGPLLPAREVPR